MLDYEWARANDIARFKKPTSVITERVLSDLERRGWKRVSVLHYLADGWCICEVNVISLKPRKIEVLRVFTKG